MPWPTQYLHLKVKAVEIEGLKNIKIRVPDKNAVDMLNAIGTAAVMIPRAEDSGAGFGRRRRSFHSRSGLSKARFCRLWA